MQEEFSTHPIEIWTQLRQGADENWDPVSMRQVWDCPITKSYSTVGKYAEYQSKSFQVTSFIKEMLKNNFSHLQITFMNSLALKRTARNQE